MQLPFRKPGKYTHAKTDFRLTKEKFGEFTKKLERLKKVSHPEAIKEMQWLAEMGDFSENAGYQIAKGRVRSINQKILELENYINHAEIIPPVNNSKTVQLGSSVTVVIAGKEKIYMLLGSAETDPKQGIVSSSSPIGAVLMGHKVGDTVIIRSANKEIGCRIVKIE